MSRAGYEFDVLTILIENTNTTFACCEPFMHNGENMKVNVLLQTCETDCFDRQN